LVRGGAGLLLHAAAVRRRGRVLLLPGKTGSGKSTLTAYLTSRGFDYLTDELAHVPPASARVTGLGAPLKIKSSGIDALKPQVALRTHTSATMIGPFDILVAPESSERASTGSPLAAIVFPRYTPRSRFNLRPLSASQTGLLLMTSVSNADALPDHGFREAARIAALAPGYAMRFANLGQIEAHFELLRSMMSASGRQSRGTKAQPQPRGAGAVRIRTSRGARE
jgi:hypothetical protein